LSIKARGDDQDEERRKAAAAGATVGARCRRRLEAATTDGGRVVVARREERAAAPRRIVSVLLFIRPNLKAIVCVVVAERERKRGRKEESFRGLELEKATRCSLSPLSHTHTRLSVTTIDTRINHFESLPSGTPRASERHRRSV
jgi:hypothetical protein